jgi:acetyl-CoA acetyltransferase/uncharacterized OB-fold protein
MAERPLPALSPENEAFWTSGADGVLRLPRCAECATLLHPSLVVCPSCGHGQPELVAVSGRATVLGFTINYQQWLPGYAPPYVIAVVAVDEDPAVRLTTNIVNTEPESVHVGMAVQVVFEQQEDVWFPLFEPLPGAPDRDLVPPLPEVAVRPMASTDKFERKVAITGIGTSDVGRRLMRAPLSLTVDACLAAIADAGLELADIDGLSTYPGSGLGAGSGHSEGGVAAVEEALRIRPTWHNGGPELSGQTGSVITAMLAVAAGLCRHVLCFRTVWEATHAELARTGRIREGRGRIGGDMQWRIPFGALSAANWIGCNASQYFHRFGGDREALAWIALNARANAGRNPAAIYRDPLTIDDYFNARMITTPFGLYDCDVPCDGSVAVIVSSLDAARNLPRQPVRVEAVGTQITERVSWDQGTVTHEPQVFGPARHLWSRTDLRPSDVDVAELYDGFTFNCLSWIEALGFCEIGEAPVFLAGGKRIALDGDLPLNTHGGQLSAGRTHGYGFLHEAVVQLRGDGGARQVQGAEVALVSTGGGVPGGCMLLTTDR